jgi:hypothetical protein
MTVSYGDAVRFTSKQLEQVQTMYLCIPQLAPGLKIRPRFSMTLTPAAGPASEEKNRKTAITNYPRSETPWQDS